MNLEIAVSLFVAVLVVLAMVATWWGRGRRMREAQAIALHLDSLPPSRPVLRVVKERHPTPKATAKATRRR